MFFYYKLWEIGLFVLRGGNTVLKEFKPMY